MTKTVDVLLPLPIDQLFSYAVEEDTEVSIGDYVVVPFARKRLIGIVWRESSKSDRELKFIEQKIDLPSIRPKLIEFAKWVAQYNVIPIGMLAKVIMGGVLKVNQIDKLVCTKQKQEISEIDYQLSPEQQVARDKIISNLNEYSVTLLDGETGSGKTEVYLSVIARLIEIVNDAQVLILLPEIVLTSQLVNRVRSQTSGNIAEWHSGLTPKARRNNWLNIANGSAQIIIGARSALFYLIKT